MKVAILKINRDSVLEVALPDSLADVKLSAFTDFVVEAEKIGGPGINPILQMAKAVSAFYATPIEPIMAATVGELWFDEKAVESTIAGLYKYALNIAAASNLDTAPPFSFDHKGERFSVPGFIMDAATGAEIMPTLTTAEAIEAAEVNRLIGDKIAIATNGDVDGSLMFTKRVRTLAVIARLDGEKLPISESGRDAFIEARTGFFVDIDAETGLRADFFLAGTLSGLKEHQAAGGSLIHRVSGLTVETLLRSKGLMPALNLTTPRYLSASAGDR